VSRLAFLHPALIGMGLHVASARVRRAAFGHRRYDGTAEEILRSGLEDCWSGAYLTASPGHYRQFWTRDTGFAAPSLVRLGGPWPDRLLASLTWALEVWRDRRAHVSTTINPLLRWPVDIFDYGVDSLPLLLASLQALTTSADGGVAERGVAERGVADGGVAERAHRLVDRHRAWIESEVEHFVETVVDPTTGLVRTDRAFSAHRDTFRNGSTAYANAMVALLARTVAETGWGPDSLSRHFVASAAPAPGLADHAFVGEPAAASRATGSAFVFPDSPSGAAPISAMPLAGIRTRSSEPEPALDRSPSPSPSTEPSPVPAPKPSRTAALRMPATVITEMEDAAKSDSGNTSSVPSAASSAPAEASPGSAAANPGTAEASSTPAQASTTRDWGILLRRHFWLGDRFRDRLGSDETSGEANVWPFHLGLIDDDAMLATALATLASEGFTAPYPLRFEASHRADRLLLAYRLWSADYQTTTSWTSIGSIYLRLLRRVDPAAARLELDRMRALIERDRTFWEVLDSEGRPWRSRSRLSVSDQSMLWGAILLETMLDDAAGDGSGA
jgi:hypothetical protein